MFELRHAKKFADQLGPGLITGLVDDDPSGLATYSQVGVQFGAELLRTLAFTTPLMIGIQIISARLLDSGPRSRGRYLSGDVALGGCITRRVTCHRQHL